MKKLIVIVLLFVEYVAVAGDPCSSYTNHMTLSPIPTPWAKPSNFSFGVSLTTRTSHTPNAPQSQSQSSLVTPWNNPHLTSALQQIENINICSHEILSLGHVNDYTRDLNSLVQSLPQEIQASTFEYGVKCYLEHSIKQQCSHTDLIEIAKTLLDTTVERYVILPEGQIECAKRIAHPFHCISHKQLKKVSHSRLIDALAHSCSIVAYAGGYYHAIATLRNYELVSHKQLKNFQKVFADAPRIIVPTQDMYPVLIFESNQQNPECSYTPGQQTDFVLSTPSGSVAMPYQLTSDQQLKLQSILCSDQTQQAIAHGVKHFFKSLVPNNPLENPKEFTINVIKYAALGAIHTYTGGLLIPAQTALTLAMKMHELQSVDTTNMTPNDYAEFIAEQVADITYTIAATKLVSIAKDTNIPQGFVSATREIFGTKNPQVVTSEGVLLNCPNELGVESSVLKNAGSKVGSTSRSAITKVSNMKEFFETSFGKCLKGNLQKTSKQYKGQSIYQVVKKMPEYGLKKGDLVYLDSLHFDHLEVFSNSMKPRNVLNLDGSLNQAKTAKIVGRKL